MIEHGLVIGDEHLDATRTPDPAYDLVRRFAESYAPWDWIVDLGDVLDLPYLASFNKETVEVMSDGRFVSDYELLREHIDYFKAQTAQYTLLQGNHDERVDRFLERFPIFSEMIDYESYFKFERDGVEYLPQVVQPYRKRKLFFAHGWWATKYAAGKALDEIGGNIIFGHWHKFQTVSKVSFARSEEMQAWAIGCLCGLLPGWKKGRPSGWQKGFATVEMDSETGRFNVYPVNIINDSFLYEGELWP